MPAKFDAELIRLIRCPVTKTRLSEADNALIEQLNQQISQQTLTDQTGQAVGTKLDGGFVNEDKSLLLPVRGGIVVLTADQAISMKT